MLQSHSPFKELGCNVNVCVIVLFAKKWVDYFKKFEEIIDPRVMKYRGTKQPRGFGFVTYSYPSIVYAIMLLQWLISDWKEDSIGWMG
jgi:hypothetical protein